MYVQELKHCKKSSLDILKNVGTHVLMSACSQLASVYSVTQNWNESECHSRSSVRRPALDPCVTLMIQMEEILTERKALHTAVHVQQPQVQVTLNESISCQLTAQSHMTRSSRGPESSNRHWRRSISLSVWWKLKLWSEPGFKLSCYRFRHVLFARPETLTTVQTSY